MRCTISPVSVCRSSWRRIELAGLPRLPINPVGNGVEEFRALSQVGDGEGHCGFHVRTYLFARNPIARHQKRPSIGKKPKTEQPLTKKTVDVLGSSMAYHERGEGAPVLFLHGNPTSSYLWRDVIPELEGRGRLIAPDLIGMGDSGKLSNPGPCTYRFVTHRDYLAAFIDAVIGPEEKIMFVERVLPGSVLRKLTEAEMTEYRKPFLNREDRWPTLTWPRQIPIAGEPADVVQIVADYAQWMADNDVPKLFVEAVPGAILIGA